MYCAWLDMQQQSVQMANKGLIEHPPTEGLLACIDDDEEARRDAVKLVCNIIEMAFERGITYLSRLSFEKVQQWGEGRGDPQAIRQCVLALELYNRQYSTTLEEQNAVVQLMYLGAVVSNERYKHKTIKGMQRHEGMLKLVLVTHQFTHPTLPANFFRQSLEAAINGD